jgi:UDP-arabinose 4-epimerase
MGKSILVVGGAGYVGSHTCKVLASSGFLPVVYDNLSTGHREFVRWGPLVEGDIQDTDTVLAALRQYKITAVIHFAASALVGESVTDPKKYYHNNVAGTLSLLSALRAARRTKLVFSSTCAVYGEPRSVPITENEQAHPINPYGMSKLMVERILADYARAYGFQSVCLRYFNACGADPEGEAGELRDPETHLIPRAIMALQGHVSDFAVFGSDFDTPDGTAIRDYIHVTDLARAHVLALESLTGQQPESHVYNLGTGRGYSVKEVLVAIETITRRSLPSVLGARRPGDPAILIADPSRAVQKLGFKPVASNLQYIVKTAWAWHQRAHPYRARPGGADLC